MKQPLNLKQIYREEVDRLKIRFTELSQNRKKVKIVVSRNILKILSSNFFQIIVLILILSSVSSLMLLSVTELKEYSKFFLRITFLSSIVFTIEYILRLATAPMKFSGKNSLHSRIKYIFSFFGIVDLAAIIPFILLFIVENFYEINSPDTTKIIQLATLECMFNTFKLIRYSPGFKMMGKVFHMVRNELIATFTACGIIILLASTIIYYLESDIQPEVFQNLGDGLWWSIITFTTIGYGDIVPITAMGRILGGFIGIFGILIVAIPTALISSAFFNVRKDSSSNNLEIDNQIDRYRRQKRRKCPHCNKTFISK